MKKLACVFLLIVINGAVGADSITITLDVPSMYCPLCPITVSKALENVEGVATVDTSLESKTATVTFNDEITKVEALIAATTNAGFPSSLASR